MKKFSVLWFVTISIFCTILFASCATEKQGCKQNQGYSGYGGR
jgi:hypothetical protein